MRRSNRHQKRRTARRAFTLVELVIAGIAGLLVVAAVTSALFQSARARSTTKSRLVAYSRANSALDLVRGEIAATMRRSDLFETRVLLYDDVTPTQIGELDRDELLIFNVSLRALRPIEYEGEGQEYESHFRIGEDQTGTALWQRRDCVLDEWADAGGLASPVANGIVGLKIQAYDGESWFDEWDSDIDGLPWAIRITVSATGNELGEDPLDEDAPMVTLRTQIAIDRIIPPPPPDEDEADGEDGEGDQGDTGGDSVDGITNGGTFGGGGGMSRPSGGGRPTGGSTQESNRRPPLGSGGSRGGSGGSAGVGGAGSTGTGAR